MKRPTHRKRTSAFRLSFDTTSTLPEYNPTPAYHHWSRRGEGIAQDREEERQIPSDKPPDYPDSAEEADEDTDESDDDSNVVYPHLLPSAVSPKRPKQPKQPIYTHKRKLSSQCHLFSNSSRSQHHKPRLPPPTDPFLDSLLERSVHALEMSNTLLQSSISTQTSLSAILAGGSGSPQESTLEAHAVNLNTRIRDTVDARVVWADNLEEITRDVEGLFGPDSTAPDVTEEGEGKESVGISIPRQFHRREVSGSSGISCSLPDPTLLSSGSFKRSRRRPSLDLQKASLDGVPTHGLHYAQQSRENLISPPPRPITQFMPDIDDIVLPSTIGIRSQRSVYLTDQWKSVSELASSSTTSLLGIPSLSTPSLPPKLTDKLLEPSTPAYNMLSSFVNRQPSTSGTNTPSTSFTTSFMANLRRPRNTDTCTNGIDSNLPVKRLSSSAASHDCTLRLPNRVGVTPLSLHRTMTPPVEESSSSSSDSCVAKRTVQSLRKILDEQPQPIDQVTAFLSRDRLKPPKFMPRTPAPVPEAGTSTATASISRLFTKGTHSSSTHAPLPPRQSAMKNSKSQSSSSIPETPSFNAEMSLVASTTPSVSSAMSASTPTSSKISSVSIPDMVSKVLSARAAASVSASASSSGRSTPNKRISFAELPESYASTRPGGPGSSKFNEKHSRRKRISKTKDDSGGEASEGGFSRSRWWLGVVGGGLSSSSNNNNSLARQEERMEDRMTRGWAGRMGVGLFGGLDEWAV